MFEDISMALRTTVACDSLYEPLLQDLARDSELMRSCVVDELEDGLFSLEYNATRKIGPLISEKRVKERTVEGWGYNMRSFIFYEDVRDLHEILRTQFKAGLVATTDLSGEKSGRAIIDDSLLCSYYIRLRSTTVENKMGGKDPAELSEEIQERLSSVREIAPKYCKLVNNRDILLQTASSSSVTEYKILDNGLVALVVTPLSDSVLRAIYSSLSDLDPLEIVIASVDEE